MQLLTLLLGVVALWSYIGWRVDTRNVAPRPNTALCISFAILGCVFALFVFVEGVRMFHAGLLYKFVAISWSLVMFRHFALLLRTSPLVPEATKLSSRRRLPRLTLGSVALCWAVLLVAACIAPVNSSGRPDARVMQVFGVCFGVLIVATAYSVLVYLVRAWRRVPASEDRLVYVVWVGFETFLAVSAVAAMAYVAARG